jgi:Arc/MetJ family transcription regulator
MARKTKRVLIDRELADQAMRAFGVKSRTEAVRIAVRFLFGLDRLKTLTEVAANHRQLEPASGGPERRLRV